MNITRIKKYLNINSKEGSKINKQNKSDNKPDIVEQKIIRNKFGYPIQLGEKYNKIKPK